MTTEYTLPLAHADATLATVGGKGASLAKLAGAGLPVPGGFHITTAAYDRFVAENHLRSAVLAALEAAAPALPASLEAASRTVAGLFDEAAIPKQIAAAVAQAYAALGEEPPVAVRSSATAEDLPGLSFAGQQETFLNVRGTAAVLDAVRRCWASLWTARAIGYRARNGIDSGSVSIAVVVQLLVPAEAAGVMFTANPVSGRREEAVITATWGLGESIVGGIVTPDTLTVDKASGRVLRRETADKGVMTVRTKGGTEERLTPEVLRSKPVLSDEQAAELTRHGVRIEELYGMPMDIEWALAGTELSILQARPITALPEPQVPPPTGWPRPDPKGMYSRGSMAEHLTNPVTPLFGTLGVRLANAASDEMMRKFGFKTGRAGLGYEYVPINGYVYLGVVVTPRSAFAMMRLTLSQARTMLRGGIARWREARGQLAAVVADWEAKPVEALSPSELWTGAQEVLTAAMRFYTIIQAGTLPTASTSEAVFTRIYNMVSRKGDPEAATLLFGFDTVALLAEKSLFDLAQLANARPALREYLLRTPAGDIASGLRVGEALDAVPGPDWAEWRSRFERHLNEFGRTAYELDFANPTPVEMPETLLDAVRLYLEGRGSNPYERQREAAERREQATEALLSRFMLFPKRWFKRVLRWAQSSGPAREDSLADMGMGHAVIRRMLGELGSRFAAAGAVESAGDIYWLLEEEVDSLAARLERGEPLPAYGERIPARRAGWGAQLKAVPPAILPENSRWAKLVPWARENATGAVLKGIGTSAGKVTAPACVLFGPEDFDEMRPGAVLVAVTTSPAWTPLFTMASAVVTDIGGPLSHSSIVAREYGIPAVMATGVATRRIRSGELITVDGSAGLVTLPEQDGHHADAVES
jgi:rifampicin phosphotransferase